MGGNCWLLVMVAQFKLKEYFMALREAFLSPKIRIGGDTSSLRHRTASCP